MIAVMEPLRLSDFPTIWPIPCELSDFDTYGLWNCVGAYDQTGRLLEAVAAHDGDFFPESPLDHIERIREGLRLSEIRRHNYWPVRVDVDITQKCTRNCYFCYSRRYAFQPLYLNAEIPATIFEAILEELADGGTKSIRFTGGGEPLIHPEIKEMLLLPKRYALRSCLITNGDLLDEEICELVVANVDHIRISINAARTCTRARLRGMTPGVNGLFKIYQYIKHMARLREAVWPSQRKPGIWATFLILPENASEIYLAAQMVRDCGVDSISFRPVYHNLCHRFTVHDMSVLQEQLRSASSLHNPPIFQVFTPKRHLTLAGPLPPVLHFKECMSSRLRTIIEATSLGPMIRVCGLHRGTGKAHLGLIERRTRFSELWNSRRTEEILCDLPEVCEGCIDVSMNVTLNGVRRILREHPDAVFRKSWQKVP